MNTSLADYTAQCLPLQAGLSLQGHLWLQSLSQGEEEPLGLKSEKGGQGEI